MNAELKSKWIAALRSGDYKQGLGMLRSGDRFCCLGVYCEVAGVPRLEDGYRFGDNRMPHVSVLPMPESNALRTGTLIEMNDTGKSFAEIANWIEQHIPTDEATS